MVDYCRPGYIYSITDLQIFQGRNDIMRLRAQDHLLVELGGTQILETVQYFIKYHGINKYYGILINAFMYPVKYSNNFSQVTSV